MLRYFFKFLLAPFYNWLMHLIAYGPWGSFIHGILIWLYKKCLGIEYSRPLKFARLGDFFLRPIGFNTSEVALVSPVEACVLDGPRQLDLHSAVEVKGLTYKWSGFPELDSQEQTYSFFWNFYLSPRDYHWFHAPCAGEQLEAYRHAGASFPVNGFGRWLCPELYSENERLSFRWTHPQLGRVLLICVGAMGVSRIRSELGEVAYNRWTPLQDQLNKMDCLGGFELGSTVLLLVQEYQSFQRLGTYVRPGEPLLFSEES